jgi:hypothetical protein
MGVWSDIADIVLFNMFVSEQYAGVSVRGAMLGIIDGY